MYWTSLSPHIHAVYEDLRGEAEMKRTNSKPGRGREYYARYLKHYTKKNYALLLLGGMFLLGTVLGALLARSAGSDTLALLLRLTNGFLEKRRSQSFLQNLIVSGCTSLGMVAALFVCGFCAISQPLVAALPLLRGMGFGFSITSLYARYGTAAVGFTSVLILPGMVLSTVAILLCCRESLRLSNSVLSLLGSAQQNGRKQYPLRAYLGKYTAAVLLCVVSAVVEAGLYAAFSGFFALG